MRRLRGEDGFALVPTMAAVIIVLLLGTAVLSKVNAQSSQSGLERTQEASFQLADAALSAQLQGLERTWPGTSATALPPCDQSSTPTSVCMGTELAKNFTALAAGSPNGGPDFSGAPQWETRVIDDRDGPEYYDDGLATAPVCACDENGNRSVWVRAEAQVGPRKTVLVGLVTLGAPRLEELPPRVVLAGSFSTDNNGNKVIVDAKGDSATVGNVSVRCDSGGPSRSDPCLSFDPGKGQLSPEDAWDDNYSPDDPGASPWASLDPAALQRLRLTAQAMGSYYATGCPETLTGQMVFIENPSNGTCEYRSSNGKAVYNSKEDPGVVILAGGNLQLNGGTYYGVIYAANRQGTVPAEGPCTSAYEGSEPVVDLTGNPTVVGAILVDGCGTVRAGSNKWNIIYDARVFAGVQSLSPAHSVKNSFRIIPAS